MTNYYTQGFIYLNSKDTNMKKPILTSWYPTLHTRCAMWPETLVQTHHNYSVNTVSLTLFVLLFSSLKCFRLDYMERIWVLLGFFVCVLFLADSFFTYCWITVTTFLVIWHPECPLKKIPTVNSTLKQNKNMLNK